jgi:hypothetical protein
MVPTKKTELRRRADVWRIVDRIERVEPERNVFGILRAMLGVCPEGMITDDVRKYLELEVVCETYKSPPVAGGVDDWPGPVYDAFCVIRGTHQRIVLEKQKELAAKTGK